MKTKQAAVVFAQSERAVKTNTKPAPVERPIAIRKGILFSMTLFAILLMGVMIPSQQAFAQITGAPDPCPNCTAEDIKIVKPFMVLQGTPAPTCPAVGTGLSGQIKLALDVTAKQRYGLAVVAELWVNGSFVRVIDTCYRRDFSQGKDTLAFGALVSFNAGQSVELKKVMTAWDNQKPSNKYPNYAKPCDAVLKTNGVVSGYDCKVLTDIQGISLTPKCKYYTLIAVETPPVKPNITKDDQVNVLCNGNATGSINISVSPATQPPYSYTYSWTGPNSFTSSSQDISGLKAGTYYITVTIAAGCSNTANWTITEPTALGGSASTTPVSCNGGSNGTATVTPTGGTSLYTYLWSNGQTTNPATGLAAGTYTCTIKDANNCTFTVTSIVVSQPGSLSASITAQTNVLCHGNATGSATVTPSGGTSPYTYSWSPSGGSNATASGLTDGTYVVTVTDNNGCTTTATAIITEPDTLEVTATAAQSLICEGTTTSISVSASGGNGSYQYKLDGGSYQAGSTFSDVAVGLHTVTVKDANNCTATDEVEIEGKECNRFCTYTQGYFGTDNLGKANYDQGDGCLQTVTRVTLQNSLNWWDDNGGMQIGNITSNNITVESILNYLPGGGTSGSYSGSTLSGAPSNTLLAQTLTLGLNIGLNQYLGGYIFHGDIHAQKTNGSCGQGDAVCGDCKSYCLPAAYQEMTVLEIFEAAGNALVSGTAEERNTLASIAGAINEAFDECAKSVPACETLGGAKNGTLSKEEYIKGTIPSKLVVRPYPNPFAGTVYLSFVAPVAGNATIEFYDLDGRMLDVQHKNNVIPGQENIMKYDARNFSGSYLLYRVKVGEFSENGKIMKSKN